MARTSVVTFDDFFSSAHRTHTALPILRSQQGGAPSDPLSLLQAYLDSSNYGRIDTKDKSNDLMIFYLE